MTCSLKLIRIRLALLPRIPRIYSTIYLRRQSYIIGFSLSTSWPHEHCSIYWRTDNSTMQSCLQYLVLAGRTTCCFVY